MKEQIKVKSDIWRIRFECYLNSNSTKWSWIIIRVFLHCTFSLAMLDWTVPTALADTHTYWPLSPLFTFVMTKSVFSNDKLILDVTLTTDPSLVHDNVGEGFPDVLQVKVALSPSVSVWLFGCWMNSGLSVDTEIRFSADCLNVTWKYIYIYIYIFFFFFLFFPHQKDELTYLCSGEQQQQQKKRTVN